MTTLPAFPGTKQRRPQHRRPSETLRRGVSFVLGRVQANVDMATAYRLGVASCTLLVFGLGFLLWDRFPFREDEAIYAYWALHFAHMDPWFLTVWPDKPPLFLWSLAGVFELFGPSPASARFLNMAITGLTVPVVAAIARRLWGPSAGLLAAVTFALNPFVLSFAPTAYTDPMLVLWGMVALYAALARRPFWAGMALGAAIMTKQQGVLFVPLVLGIMAGEWRMANGKWRETNAKSPPIPGPQSPSPDPRSPFVPFAIRHSLGLALVVLPIVLWDSQRWAVAPSPWDLAARNYGGLTLLAVDQWGARWREWGGLLWEMGGSWWVWMGVGVGVISGKAKGNAQRAPEKAKGKRGVDRRNFAARSPIPDPRSLIPNPQSLLFLWTVGFVAFHLFTTVQPWDRYLLPLAPMLALLAGWIGHRLIDPMGTAGRGDPGAGVDPAAAAAGAERGPGRRPPGRGPRGLRRAGTILGLGPSQCPRGRRALSSGIGLAARFLPLWPDPGQRRQLRSALDALSGLSGRQRGQDA